MKFEFDLPLRELRYMYNKINSSLYEYPELTDLKDMLEKIRVQIKSHPDYIKGEALLKKAEEESGLDSGYASADDYYFAVIEQKIGKRNHTELVLCFKWNWWMNGQSFIPHHDGGTCRNFDEFLPKECIENFIETGEYDCSAEELKKALLKAGMEEKPELAKYFKDHCKLINSKRRTDDYDEEKELH